MATSNDSLNFFVLEAGECLERLDATLASAGPSGPDAIEFVRHARTLRGAALMHRLSGMAELAAAVERAGRALRDGSARWSPAVAAALVAAVDDLKILLHNIRIWGPNEEARATRRLADLARVIPATDERAHAAAPSAGSTGTGMAFLAQEAMETATALESLEEAVTLEGGAALDRALGHVHTLRGVAAVHDVPPIPEVLDAVDRAARSIAVARAAPSRAQSSLFAASAALLRRTASDLRSLGRSEPGTPEERRFQVARDALMATAADADRILPISELFYGGDERGGVVSRAPSPPTTPADRFRLEVVSLAEHLRGLVRDAQASGPGPVPDRTVAELRSALRSVRNAAESFGERDVADFLGTFTDGHPVFDFLTLNAIDDLVALMTEPTATAAGLSSRMAELARGRALDTGIAHGLRPSVVPPAAQRSATPRPVGPAPVAPPTAEAVVPARDRRTGDRGTGRERLRTPTGPDLQALLADGIAGFSPLGDLPLIDQSEEPQPVAQAHSAASEPGPEAAAGPVDTRRPVEAPTAAVRSPAAASMAPEPSATHGGSPPSAEPAATPPAQGLVSIESLLYRGDSALTRARALRDTLRATGAPPADTLAELYDLLDLAITS